MIKKTKFIDKGTHLEPVIHLDPHINRKLVAKKMRGEKHYEHMMEKARGVSRKDRERGVRWQNKTPQNERFFKTIKENWSRAGKNQKKYNQMRAEGKLKDPR